MNSRGERAAQSGSRGEADETRVSQVRRTSLLVPTASMGPSPCGVVLLGFNINNYV